MTTVDDPATADVTLARLPYWPSIDGLRAVALIVVLLGDAGELGGGVVAMDVFFVVSGFLITVLIMRDALRLPRVEKGRQYWRRRVAVFAFWARRIRRIAPTLLLVVMTSEIWSYFHASSAAGRSTDRVAAWSLAGGANWFALFAPSGFASRNPVITPLDHLWAVAIEEQFYFVWPLALIILIRFRRRLVVTAVVAGTVAVTSAAWQWVAADRYGPGRAFLGTDTRAGAFGIGCLLGVLLLHRGQSRDRPLTRGARALCGTVFLCGSGVLGVAWTLAEPSRIGLYHGALIACSVAAAAVIAVVVIDPDGLPGAALSLAPLTWLGRRSYALYLWHWPIWIMIRQGSLQGGQWSVWSIRLAAMLVSAELSYTLVERTVRFGPGLAARRVVPALVVVSLMVSAIAVVAPRPQASAHTAAGSGPSQSPPSAYVAADPCGTAATPALLGDPPYSSTPDPEYPDSSGRELVDGLVGQPSIADPTWQGWQTQFPTVIFRLARPQQVCGVTTNWMQELAAAVYVPSLVAVFITDTPGSRGRLLGSGTGTVSGPQNQQVGISVSGPPISGSYVVIQVHRARTYGWSFADEMAVFTRS